MEECSCGNCNFITIDSEIANPLIELMMQIFNKINKDQEEKKLLDNSKKNCCDNSITTKSAEAA